jgi:starch phosphorylase
VEIYEQVGEENIYIFGMRSDTVDQLRREGSYHPWNIVENNAEIRKVINQWQSGWILPNDPSVMNAIRGSLLEGDWADTYFVLKDFGSYSMANKRIMDDYQDRDKWLRMAVMNTAMSGFFSSDRTIREYNERIWHVQKLED